jgi:hypothetical protein
MARQTFSKSGLGSHALLDCVKQYGLNYKNYHPKEVSYEVLKSLDEDPSLEKLKLRAKTDLLITDAVISLICHLHYGMLNPDASTRQLEAMTLTGLVLILF